MEGMNLSLENLKNIQLQLVIQVEQALQILDPAERQEYGAAMQAVPDLVRKETPVLNFLRTEDYRPIFAARRLALYWKYRRDIFGERWLLPMNQTGSGALSTEDIKNLQTGYKIVFQRGPEDGLLFLLDETRLARSDERVKIRLAFYYGTVFTDETTQVHGATFLHVVRTGERPTIEMFPDGWRMIRTGLPLRCRQILVARAHESGEQRLLDHLTQQCAIMAQINYQHPAQIIAANSPAGILQQLESKGCRKALVPPCLGGSFDYAEFANWMHKRISIEKAIAGGSAFGNGVIPMPAPQRLASVATTTTIASSSTNTSGSTNQPASLPPFSEAAVSAAAAAEATPPKKGEILTAEDIRKRNALYSRRTYHKRKLELLSLEEQVRRLESRNESLRQEANRLEALTRAAHALLATYGVRKYG